MRETICYLCISAMDVEMGDSQERDETDFVSEVSMHCFKKCIDKCLFVCLLLFMLSSYFIPLCTDFSKQKFKKFALFFSLCARVYRRLGMNLSTQMKQHPLILIILRQRLICLRDE
jgi:hypothetical protein